MASIAVRVMADVGNMTQEFGRGAREAENFKAKLVQVGEVAGRTVVSGFKTLATGAGNVLTHLGRLSSVASSSAAILSKFSQGNEELKKRFESLTITLAILAPALSALGPAIAFLSGPIGLVVAAIGAAILIFVKWETVSRVVTDTAAAVWAKLGEFLMSLWGGLGEAAQGLGQILLGALTLDAATIQAGYQQMLDGFTAVANTMVTAAGGIASGIGNVGTKLGEMASALTTVQEKAVQSVEALNPLMTQLNAIQSAELQALETARQVFEEQQQRTAEMQAAAQVASIQADQDFQTRLAEIHSVLLQELANAQAAFEERQQALQQLQAEQGQAALVQAQDQAIAAVGILAGLFGQNKAFAIATALIDTFMAVDKALASAPPPASFVLAAATLAFGLAKVAQIKGTKFAEGGIVTGPTRSLIGEAGPEAVIPLSSSRGRAALAEIGGGRQVMIMHFQLDGRAIGKFVTEFIPGEVRIRAGIRGA